MKKFMKLLLVSLITLSLVACGGGNNDKPEDNDQEKETINLKCGVLKMSKTYWLNVSKLLKPYIQIKSLILN